MLVEGLRLRLESGMGKGRAKGAVEIGEELFQVFPGRKLRSECG